MKPILILGLADCMLYAIKMYSSAYYRKINLEEIEQAERLARLLIWIYSPKSVIDIGSATGLYLKPFLDAGIKVTGVDYSEAALTEDIIMIPRKYLKKLDITKKPVGSRADLSLCIETLEHIPAELAHAAIKNISKTSDTIFFTAAQPGQGGVGHVNCQPKEYWEAYFNKQTFERDLTDEQYIKAIMMSGYHMGWLINNLMVFKKSVAK